MDEQQRAVLSFHAGRAVEAAMKILSPELPVPGSIILAEALHSIIYHAMCRAALEVCHEQQPAIDE